MDEIELFFVVKVKNKQVVGVESGPHVDFEIADQKIAQHKYSADKYRVAKVKMPFELVD